MGYVILNSNRYYAMLTETSAVKKTANFEEATIFESMEQAVKVMAKASRKLKDYTIVREEEIKNEKGSEEISEDILKEDANVKLKRRPFNQSERTAVYNRAFGRCELCGGFVPIDKITLDHIVPLCKGGTYDLDNLQLAHEGCNMMKHHLDSDEFYEKMMTILEYQAKKNPKIRKKIKKRFA